VCDDKRERERERERARNDDSSYEGINRQIQSQRAVFSWSTKAGDPLVVFSGHEFHLREEKNSFPSKQKRVKKR
jgi:hypothetical protein